MLKLTPFSISMLGLVVFMSLSVPAQKTIKLNGVVFEDVNGNCLMDAKEKGISKISVSNGSDVVQTNSKGAYSINVAPYETAFVIKPSGYQLALDEFGISKAYFHYYPSGTPEMKGPGISATTSIPKKFNFALHKSDESDSIKIALWGDTQAGGQVDWNHLNKLVTEELILEGDIDFSILLGDITHDNVLIFPVAKQTLKHADMPMHIVPGNHDRDYDMLERPLDFTSFKQAFGPTVYAFNYGKTHFIVLNNIYTINDKEAAKTHSDYKGYIDETQLEFVKQDLKHVPEDHLVVFCHHIPFYNTNNYKELQKIISKRKHLLAVSGHNHLMHQKFLPLDEQRELHEVIAGATCGAWWTGELDYEGIPASRMSYGVPKGYVYLNIEGNEYNLRYKASKMPAHKQMQIWVYEPNSWDWGMQVPDGLQKNDIIANVWTGSDKTKVYMRIDNGEWQTMYKKEIADPYQQRWKLLETKGVHLSKMTRPLAKPRENNPHIWMGSYPENIGKGSHKVEIKTEDPYFEALYDVRIFTVGGSDE